VAAFQTQERKN
jgi:guanine nucleotide-binding protein G(I)/G(S)/G(T) subunit beta-1